MCDVVVCVVYKGLELDFVVMRKDTKMSEIVDEFEKAYKGVIKSDAKSLEIEVLWLLFVEIEVEVKVYVEYVMKCIVEFDFEFKVIEE